MDQDSKFSNNSIQELIVTIFLVFMILAIIVKVLFF